jgi:hypothetical protein
MHETFVYGLIVYYVSNDSEEDENFVDGRGISGKLGGQWRQGGAVKIAK